MLGPGDVSDMRDEGEGWCLDLGITIHSSIPVCPIPIHIPICVALERGRGSTRILKTNCVTHVLNTCHCSLFLGEIQIHVVSKINWAKRIRRREICQNLSFRFKLSEQITKNYWRKDSIHSTAVIVGVCCLTSSLKVHYCRQVCGTVFSTNQIA